ncbi:MAG: dockerin type I domain-containing protein [Ruminococcus sp.]|nr:dockerin type I domain-containing protein [Ruminococcus sp.]
MEGKRDYFSDPPNLDSVLYIRSEGAVAADDRWLVTGNDGGRFGFNVVKPATVQTGDSETFRLTGKGIAGANQLNWEQGTLDTLAGYNLYRSTDNGASFTKLNRSLISGEDLQYIDRDVTEGQKYSYYFTTVDTDFHESARSNVVECVPLDGEKPTIVHTPVTYSEPEKAIVITADVTDNVKVDKVELFYKYGDEADWNSVSMRNPSGSTYRATLSAYEVREGKLQYYIAASDGISKSYVGNESEPCVITVSQYPETTTASESAVTTESTTASANATASTLGTTVNTTQSAASSESATETTATESIYTSTTGYSDTTTASTNVQYSGVRIEIVSRPTKTVYEMGESLDITGFKVKTWRIDSNGNEYADNNGDAYDVSDYISRFAISEFDSTVSGDQVITITYKRYNEAMELMTDSRSFTVFVRPAESETTTPITATTALATTETTTTNATTSVNSSSFEKTATSTEKATTTVTTSAMESSSESDTTTSYESETTASTTQTAATSTSTPVTTTDVTDTDYDLGDVNADGKVDAKDASMVLVEYAKMSTGGEGDFTEKQKLAANVNFDSKIDAKDASFILAYYAMASTASGDVPTMMEYMNKS